MASGASKRDTVILAYSGGLDTSVMVPWIREKYNLDVITFTVDLGQGEDIKKISEKARTTGAVDAIAIDARNLFVDCFVWPALMAGALYEGKYPLATALGRPLIAKLMVDAARDQGAKAVAHGCTGKGNDQVRFDVTFQTLAPDLKIIAPVREWKMTRPDSLAYAAKHNIPVEAKPESPYSIDQNLFGRSCEAGVLEDPWDEPPAEAFAWSVDPKDAPNEPLYITIDFEEGRPVALDGAKMDGVPLIERLNQVGGQHGVGRIDHVENRLVGIKSRELYEAPGAVILHDAHRELESLCLSKQAQQLQDDRVAGVCGHHLQWIVVQRLPPGPVPVRGEQPAFRERPGSGEVVQGQGDGSRPAQRAQPVQQEACHLRRRRHVRSRGSEGLHPPVGIESADAGPAPAPQGRQGLRAAGAADAQGVKERRGVSPPVGRHRRAHAAPLPRRDTWVPK